MSDQEKSEIRMRTQKIISENLGVEEICVTLESYLSKDLGADELDIVEVVMALEAEFDIEIKDGELEKIGVYNRANIRTHSSRSTSSSSISGWEFPTADYLVKDLVDIMEKKSGDSIKTSNQGKNSLNEKDFLKETEENIEIKAGSGTAESIPEGVKNNIQMSESAYKILTSNIRKIQCQAAKIEVLESILNIGNSESTPASSMISSMRVNLREASEECLDSSPENIQESVPVLKEIIDPINDFLLQVSSGVKTSDPGAVFIKELMTGIVADLISLKADLNITELKILDINPVILDEVKNELELSSLGFQNLSRKVPLHRF
jgi:acyl carrier protein